MLFWIPIIVALAIKSFQGGLYDFLEPRIGVGWSYVIDQVLPFIVALLVMIIVGRRLRWQIKTLIRNHKVPLIILFIASMLAHGWILRYYFFAEDSTSILARITNNYVGFSWHQTIDGYPFASFVASYLIFQTHAWLYNVVTLVWFLFAVVCLYMFVFFWSGKKSLAILASLFFATTPTFLDLFSWQGNAQGVPLVLGITVVSFLYMLIYKKTKQGAYAILSILFFTAAIKMGFVRIAGLVLPFLVLVWIPSKAKLQWVWATGGSLGIIAVWVSFVLARFIPEGIKGLMVSSVAPRTPEFNFDGYLQKLGFYIAHLSFPSTLGRSVFPMIKRLFATFGFQVQSMVLVIGISSLVVLAIIGIAALLTGKKRVRPWIAFFAVILIIGSIFYVPFYISVTGNVALFDGYFIRLVPPYGPGSRYVFPGAIGIGLLFSLAVLWLWEKKGWLRMSGVILACIILIANTVLSVHAHQLIVKNISERDRALIRKFFALVPRDRKPKLVFSTNPARNVIDNNVSGWNWLFGFYRYDELVYSNDAEEISNLLATGKYAQNQLFAFYTNPETSSFADVTQEVRREFFVTEASKHATPVHFVTAKSQTDISKINKLGTAFMGARPLLMSSELNERIIAPRILALEMVIGGLTDVPVPYMDVVILSRSRLLSQQFWLMLRGYPPLVVGRPEEVVPSLDLLSFNKKSVMEISAFERIQMVAAIGAMDARRKSTRVEVSNIFKEDQRVSALSLVDGLFASDPTPSANDTFYRAESTPTEIILRLPYPIVLGRILLNTPKSMVNDRSPLEVTVYGGLRSGQFVMAGTLADETANTWSPNNGRLRMLPIRQIYTDTVKIVVSKTTNEPVIFDEIIVEPVESLMYLPAQIMESAERNWWYVGNADVLAALSGLPRYQTITLAWACAEDKDWERQKNDNKNLVEGIWNFQTVSGFRSEGSVSLSAPVGCSGSVLRRVVIVGPPIPTTMTVLSAEVKE